MPHIGFLVCNKKAYYDSPFQNAPSQRCFMLRASHRCQSTSNYSVGRTKYTDPNVSREDSKVIRYIVYPSNISVHTRIISSSSRFADQQPAYARNQSFIQ